MGMKQKLDQLRGLVYHFARLLVNKPISTIRFILSEVFGSFRKRFPYLFAVFAGTDE